MRIGTVSKKYNVSINNLYFYINSGLIVPPKPRGQYVFDERTLQDLETLLEFKSLGFKLKDIHRMLSLYRISDLNDVQDIEDMKQILLNQSRVLEDEKQNIAQAQQKIKKLVADLDSKFSDEVKTVGVPFRMLPMLCCPQCGGGLKLSAADMDQRYIYNADLTCSCGYEGRIEDGIFLTGNVNKSEYDRPDITRKLYKDLPSPLLSLFEKSYNWMTDKLSGQKLEDAVVMENYINAWFFLHNHLYTLKPSTMVIITDKFPETLRSYKRLIERQSTDIDFLFIANSSKSLPIKEKTVDLNIDFFGINEHNFYHESFWPDCIRPYMKDEGGIIGTYFYFKNGRRSMRRLLNEYPETSSQNFSLKFFEENIKNNYRLTDMDTAGFITDSGENLGFSFHVLGEEMYLAPFSAKVKKRRTEQTADSESDPA